MPKVSKSRGLNTDHLWFDEGEVVMRDLADEEIKTHGLSLKDLDKATEALREVHKKI